MTINPSPRRRLVLAGRVAAGLAVSAASLAAFGGSAFALDDPVVPLPDPGFAPDLEPIEPIDPIDIPMPTLYIPDLPELPELPEDTVPEDDGPELTIPDLDIPVLPLCVDWDPADMTVTHVDNGDLTATATISYDVDPANVCDELFVVQSIAEDAAMNPLGLLAEEQVWIHDLQADGDHSIAVVVPLDPCYTRVLTDGPEAYVLADDHFSEGCPDPTTTTEPPVDTTEPPVETTEPPVETTDPTVPTTVPPTVPQPGPTTTVPGGTLPQTGSSSTVIAMLGGALVLAGGALAIGVRRSQSAGY